MAKAWRAGAPYHHRAPVSCARNRPSRASAEQSVNEPDGHTAASITDEAVAVDPVAAALRILDPVIIAQPARRGLAPPFRRDAFRAFDAGNVMHRASPDEPPRHAFGCRIDDVDRFRPV